jgi:16S rRNA U516 pseudouridylate synthase RsuA-like enzyme
MKVLCGTRVRSLFYSVSRTGGQTVAGESRFVYLKYWKPRGVTCTTDRSIRGNIVDAIGHPERVFMVGRLDKDSTGLILLTSGHKTCLLRESQPL